MDGHLTVAPHQLSLPKYGTIHAIIKHVHKCTNRVRSNQTMQDLVILTEKTNQNLLQCSRIIRMHEETSMLARVLKIRVKCGMLPAKYGRLDRSSLETPKSAVSQE